MLGQTATTTAPKYNGGASVGLADAVRTTTLPLDDLSKTIAHATERVYAAADYARQVADTLLGPELPTGVKETGGVPPQLSKIAGLNDQASAHHSAIAELERQLNRLEPLRG